jgi:hypothetical protein
LSQTVFSFSINGLILLAGLSLIGGISKPT